MEFHLWQAELLSQTFRPPQFAAEQIFVASDLNLYYDPQNTGWYKRPDWFGSWCLQVISRTRLALELCVVARRC